MITPSDLTVAIVDGYVDEPAHFGVPPYISTYPRYTAGALVDAGVSPHNIIYHTIDALRQEHNRWDHIENSDLLIYIGGMTVPGKYVGGTPAEPDEVKKISWTAKGVSLLGGPIKFGVGIKNEGASDMHRDDLDYTFVAKGDVEAAAYDLIHQNLEGFSDRMRDNDEIQKWASKGSFIVKQHPNHPHYLICEIETSRGCPYRCSFCTEPLYGSKPSFRSVDSILQEISELYNSGIRHFRIGRQADILAYGGDGKCPNPSELYDLYSGIHRVAPSLETLHLDNMNPITIVNWPSESAECLRIISKFNTPGDTAAFGLESADPVVYDENNLNVTAEECFVAIESVNKESGWRPTKDSLPKLLPGINLVHGLKGETKETFELNKKFLKRVLDSGFLVRRVNIRQVMAFPGTPMSSTGASIAMGHKKHFRKYKEEVRHTFDNLMIQKVAPIGTILPHVHLEFQNGRFTFGRQLGTYPILVGFPGKLPLGTVLDAIVVNHGQRSVTALPLKLNLNTATFSELLAIPGVGKKRAQTLISNRPYMSIEAASNSIEVDISRFATTLL
ncbi:MAG TPA: radical SAM protein [Halobacteriales archaeon]|jgi:radical SAM superfamily enzyme with C-terminal helix-hairpin-helix motif|nr:radical SAM protein [Halobacteriales archaeon]|tara:strand:- start:125 stop:1801 length:1677 start_codon:yes stop_codon:yes gene_type:complete